MTQLDRLEALAEKWKTNGSLPRDEEMELGFGAANLIRVARAAKDVQEAWDAYYDSGGDLEESQTMAWAEQVVRNALAPLFAEVES